MFNIIKAIWSFIELVYTYAIKLYLVVVQVFHTIFYPFRYLVAFLMSWGTSPVAAAIYFLMAFGIILTVYRIFRGNI